MKTPFSFPFVVVALISQTLVAEETPLQQFASQFCFDCHGSDKPSGDLNLKFILESDIERHRHTWEAVVRKLRARQMPPLDARRPDERTYETTIRALTTNLDKLAKQNPQPGRTPTFRRLTRIEYQNAIRDLLDIDIDAAKLLPKDESSHGFDNVNVGGLAPTLLNRYVIAAEEISQLALGTAGPRSDIFRVRPDITQERHIPGLPIGTRGGTLIPYNFPQDGEYEVTIRLTRDRNEQVEGLHGQHEVEVLLDRRSVQRFTVKPPNQVKTEWGHDHSKVDAHLKTRFAVKAGPHKLGVTFPQRSMSLLETKRQPYQARFNMHRHPRTAPAIFQVTINGPFNAKGPGDTPSRRRIFTTTPKNSEQEDECATKIIASLARRAWRKPVTDDDLELPLGFYRQAEDFESGIESALAAILVNPQFIFRIERDPPNVASGKAYAISDIELATRQSFFLWSSIPDDKLLDVAERGDLREPAILKKQVQRMLADRRSRSLVTNFASQWLYLRNLKSVHPDMRLFPDFDHNLREAMRTETELFFESVIREDRSVLDLLKSDYTFLNERLARHYNVPLIHGSRFRRVERESGLLRHASILTVTSYATRTSPVIRGQWILKNFLGAPPPAPPDDVPALKDNTVSATLPVRERLAQHRADASCASCHNLMDPVGLSLENFDAIGRWRDFEVGHPVVAKGGLPGGSEFEGVAGLEKALTDRPELFVSTLTEKLLTYALGRGLDHHDAPAVRKIVRDARDQNYRYSAIVSGIVNSTPFLMRTAE